MIQDDDNESLQKLLKLAGERPEVPLTVESRVYHQVQKEWRKATVEPNADKVYGQVQKSWRRNFIRVSFLRWALPMGVAATAIFAMFVISQPEVVPPQIVASVSHVVGDGTQSARFALGTDVRVGDTIKTGSAEGLSLLLLRSESLRIDENSEIRIDGSDQFTLLSGRIYADTGQFSHRAGSLTIDTEFGQVTDIGTQFAVTSTESGLDVAVREGRVDVRDASLTYSARIGERLTLVPGQAADIAVLQLHDDYWNWIDALAPTYDISNKTLLEFLKWAARETGRELQFKTNELRMSAMRTDIHGSIEGLTPDEALESILLTTNVRYRIEDARIIIED